jgi:intracellular multiplication protein IcmL
MAATTTENAFYRDHYRKVVITLIVIIFLMLLLASIVMYQVFHRPLPQFGALTKNGNSMMLTSHDSPNLLPETVLTWASKAAVAAYTFDFVNYTNQIAAARPYFTNAGWNDYQNSIAGLIQTIRQNQLFVNGVVSGAPVISNQGMIFGQGYTWRVQIPILVTYQSSEQVQKNQFTMILTIVRISTIQNPTGIGIDQLVMV